MSIWTWMIWLTMFLLGLSTGVIIGLWVSQRRNQTQMDQFNQSLRDSFAALSAEALDRNADKQHEKLEDSLKPVRDMLSQAQEKMTAIERDRNTAYGKLTQQMKDAVAAQDVLRHETQNLSQTLSRPEGRGSYGELALRRVIELAGMTKHVDFYEQEQHQGRRPDVIVRLPGSRMLPIDAKAPLQLYREAYNEAEKSTQEALMKRYAKAVRDMVKDLARKDYASQDYANNSLQENTLDFVVMFLPGDQFLNAALEHDPELMEFSLQQRVLLTTPSSLMAILQAVAYGWNQKKLAEGAEQIRDLGQELYKRATGFSEHMAKLRKSLDGSVQHYNQMIGAWESRILPTTRKFKELGITANKEVANPKPIERTPRSLSEPADDTDDPR